MRHPFRPISLVTALAVLAACSSSGGDAGTTTPEAEDAPATTDVVDDEATEPTAGSDPEPAPPQVEANSGASLPDDAEPTDTAPAATESTQTEPAREYDFSAIEAIVADFVDERDLDGAGLVVVQRDDGIVHEEYWGEFDADRISLIASSSKMITAGVLFHLDDEGVLDIDAPVADVAEWGAANPDITPVQLVSNSSGLVGLLPNPAYGPYVCQYVAEGTLQQCAEDIFTTPDDDADIVAPDTEFRYGGAQWSVAGAVAEVASGKPWSQLVEETYVEPCGVDSLAYNNHFTQIGSGGFDYPVEFAGDPSTLRATDNPNMEGGAYITAPDYGRLLLMHLRDGMCGDTQVLSPAALDTMHADRVHEVYGGDDAPGYGMGWWVDADNDRISDSGAYGTVPWLDLDDGYGAYLVIEADAGTGAELASLLYGDIEAAVTAATG